MPRDTRTDDSYADLGDLAGRRDALRQAAAMRGADPRALLEAAFAELDGAVEVLTALAETDLGEATPAGAAESLSVERALLRAVFQHAPAPLFVLEPDGTVRRENGRAGLLIGAPPGYATGRDLTAFVDLPSRAAVKSQLAAAARTGTARQVECRLLGPDGPVDATLTADVITMQDGARLLVVTVAGPAQGGRGAGKAPRERAGSGEGRPPRDDLVRAMTRRTDMVTAVTRLLLDNSTFSEAVTLQRCARLLAGDISSWVIIDIERADLLRRQFVIGPQDQAAQELARKIRALDPEPASAPGQVHAAGTSVVLAHADDAGILGTMGDGTPLLMLLGATSLISVPITDGLTSYGALTLARSGDERRFEIADLGLAEDIGHTSAWPSGWIACSGTGRRP